MNSDDSNTLNPEEIKWAKRAHISTLLAYLLAISPLFNLQEASLIAVLFPLLISAFNIKSRYVLQQGMEASFLQLIVSGLLWFVPWVLPTKSDTITNALFQAFRWIGYSGIGIFHILSILLAGISISHKKNYSHFLSPIGKIFKKKSNMIPVGLEIDETTKKLYYETEKNFNIKLNSLNNLVNKLLDSKIKAKCLKIYSSLVRMKETLETKPNDMVNARHFLHYTLDSLTLILEKYIELDKLKNKDAEVIASFQKMEPVLDTILEAIEKQHRKTMDRTVLQLDTEIEVMQKTMKMGGFG